MAGCRQGLSASWHVVRPARHSPSWSCLSRSLQDDVPPFPDEQAFTIIQEQLGRPLEAVFSSISEQPVAAASLGQVTATTLMLT